MKSLLIELEISPLQEIYIYIHFKKEWKTNKHVYLKKNRNGSEYSHDYR